MSFSYPGEGILLARGAYQVSGLRNYGPFCMDRADRVLLLRIG